MPHGMIELNGVSKSFDGKGVVRDVNLSISAGEFVTLLGPSGSGKTTILRMLAGFEEESSGEIWIGGECMNGVPAYRRPINTVFQQYALFPHLNVAENIAFGLKLKKIAKDEVARRVQAALAMVRMEDFGRYRTRKLSGGQQQRVAIARAIVNQPKVLLLDEPLGALDLKLRRDMQLELKRIHRDLGITFVYVTHDQEEAMTMSDRIGVINGGVVAQFAPPEDIYARPATPFVADFIGETNLLRTTMVAEDAGGLLLRHQAFEVRVPADARARSAGDNVILSVRPECLRLVRGSQGLLCGRLHERVFAGAMVRCWVQLGDDCTVQCVQSAADAPSLVPGEEVALTWDFGQMVMF